MIKGLKYLLFFLVAVSVSRFQATSWHGQQASECEEPGVLNELPAEKLVAGSWRLDALSPPMFLFTRGLLAGSMRVVTWWLRSVCVRSTPFLLAWATHGHGISACLLQIILSAADCSIKCEQQEYCCRKVCIARRRLRSCYAIHCKAQDSLLEAHVQSMHHQHQPCTRCKHGMARLEKMHTTSQFVGLLHAGMQPSSHIRCWSPVGTAASRLLAHEHQGSWWFRLMSVV